MQIKTSIYLLLSALFILLVGCQTLSNTVKKELMIGEWQFTGSEIEKVEISQGFAGTKIKLEDGLQRDFIHDLNDAKETGPTKYIKTHLFYLHHTNGEIDTIVTNGIIHYFKGWYKSKENLIEKYAIDLVHSLSDTVTGQLKTAERLKFYMSKRKYDKAILLFSLTEQENIREIQKEKEIFAYWCAAWTFDEAKYERYVTHIKAGKAPFVYENNAWKVNEK